MKIVVSTTGKSSEDMLDKRFGRSEYFYIYDTETEQAVVLENEGAKAGGGAGIAAANQVIEEGVQVIITGNLGPNAFELVEKAGMKAYSCGVMPVDSAIELFQKGELSEINLPGMAHHGNH
ncbi:NifB/NifX family molybdenum-iron cluster-binding protein [Anaeromicropila populeti]|uniref:Predicted Fe-Mo cluster-binding protein, NifX family n=1 Tax=Anaeromicropila populeti TaxID=37658 RepID=A0A1I6K5H9_9FIRM|nr:NifB/NifX family molybdenum-iron cluster-binding protein [Anaeromicropila populeti]SFR86511.1 Predicted Fe-Mo cluster-binding protein, NifX family [Anaeromicropila populeti]